MMHHRPYTLIEVLAAVAVLVLMMSFLFQFTSGAQRIWSASNTQTTITDNADNIFALLKDDLMQMQVDSEIGLSYNVSGSSNIHFFTLSTREEATTGTKVGSLLYVEYQLNDQKLYRFEKSADDTNNPIFSSSDNNTASPSVTISYDEAHLIAEGVESFKLTPQSGVDAWELPGFIRVDIKLDNPNKKTDEDGNSVEKFSVAKSYSQVFFIGMR